MENIKKYPLGQLFGRPFEKIDFVILDNEEILALIKHDVNAHVQQYHQHDFYAISWVQSGQLQQKLDGKVFTLNPGDIFVACPGQVHENDFGINANQVKGGAFLFTSEFLQQLRQHTAIAELTILDNILSNPCHPLQGEDLDSFLSMIHILNKEVKKELPNMPMVRSLLCAVLLSIQQTVDNSIIQANSARHIEVYKKFKHLLELHFRENKTSHFYSEQMYISDRHLNRLLKEATTKTAADIILGRSILEARRLLCFTEMTISEISWSLGYQDPSYFTKLFKKAAGQTPLAYRMSMS